MNTYWKKAVCLAVSLTLAVSGLAGCAKGEKKNEEKDKETAMGRYLESDMPLPEGTERILALGKLEDGSLELFGESGEGGKRVLWQSKDQGESWEEISCPDIMKLENSEYLDRAVISPKGDLAALGVANGEEKYALFYGGAGESGQKVPVELPAAEGGNENGISDMKFAPDGRMLIRDYAGNVHTIDPSSGQILQTYKGSGEKIWMFEVLDDKLLAVTETQVQLLDLKSGDPLDKDEVLEEQIFNGEGIKNTSSAGFNPMVFLQGKEENTLFLCGRDGIYRHISGGSVMEQVVNGGLTSLGNPSLGLLQMITLEDGSFMVSCAIGIDYQLLKYTYSPDTPAMPEKELKVYSLEDNSDIRQAISVYQKEHTDVYVNLEVGITGEDGATVSDALRTLNTDIMAGEGPDLLFLDGMPITSYIEKGLLADISDIPAEAGGQDGLFEKVANAFAKDGKTYGIPLGFRIPLFQGDEETAKAAGNLSSLAERVKSLRAGNPEIESILSPADAWGLLETLYRLDCADWQKEDGTLKEEAVTEFLRQVKAIYDTGIPKEEDTSNVGTFEFGAGGAGGFLSMRVDYMSLMMKKALASVGWMGSASEYSSVISAQKDLEDNVYKNIEKDGKKVFLPYLTAGVSSKSENKELAADFLKALLQEEIQSSITGAFPVNKKGFEGTLKNPYGEEGGAELAVSGEGSDDMFTMSLLWPDEEQLEELRQMLEAADTPSLTDETIWNVVKEQGEKYLEGSQELEEAVNNIMQKVNLYLAE